MEHPGPGRGLLVITVAALLVLAPATLAQAEPGAGRPDLRYQPPRMPTEAVAGRLLGRLVLLTVITVGVCLLGLWLARRTQRLPQTAPGHPDVQVVESLALGPRCALHLLQVEDESFLAGTDATGLKVLVPLAGSFEDLLAGEAPPASPR